MQLTSNWLLKARYAMHLILDTDDDLTFDFNGVYNLKIESDDLFKINDQNVDIMQDSTTVIKHFLRFDVRKHPDLNLYCEIIENWFIAQLLKGKIVTSQTLKELIWRVRLQ